MSFLSAEREPLRRYLYGILGSALAVLLIYGVVTAEQAAAFGALGGAVLLVPAVEIARSRVDSPATAAAKAEVATAAVAEAQASAVDALVGAPDPMSADLYVGRHAAP